jgi:hypothetical protein
MGGLIGFYNCLLKKGISGAVFLGPAFGDHPEK